jgi:hypothetical protein
VRRRSTIHRDGWFVRMLGFLVVTMLGSCATCNPPEPLHVDPDGYWVGDECPDHEDYRSNGEARPDSFRVSLAPRTGPIAEYHDCQRLIVGQNYGPLVGVWAAEERTTLTPADYENPNGVAVAQVYNFTVDVPYTELGIKQGNHCLYLFKSGANWSARMLYRGVDLRCDRLLNPADLASTQLLAVRRIPTNAMLPGDYPATARWDSDGSQHFIGVRCLDAWCEIGTPTVGNSASYAGTRVTSVKGWYDEQQLSVPTWNGRLKPGGAVGTLVPDPNLESYTFDTFRCAPDGATTPCHRTEGWVPVATMKINVNVQHYVDRLNLRAGTSSQIFMRYDPHPESGATRWQTKIVSGSVIRYYRAVRVDHTGIAVPGTARWRWLDDDETVWVRCAPGCCTSGDDLNW